MRSITAIADSEDLRPLGAQQGQQTDSPDSPGKPALPPWTLAHGDPCYPLTVRMDGNKCVFFQATKFVVLGHSSPGHQYPQACSHGNPFRGELLIYR